MVKAFLKFFFEILFYFLTLQYCIGFAIYQCESATGIHVFSILNPSPSSLPVPSLWVVFLSFLLIFKFYYFYFYFTILYWFCHISTCIYHRCTRVPHPEPPSNLPPHTKYCFRILRIFSLLPVKIVFFLFNIISFLIWVLFFWKIICNIFRTVKECLRVRTSLDFLYFFGKVCNSQRFDL